MRLFIHIFLLLVPIASWAAGSTAFANNSMWRLAAKKTNIPAEKIYSIALNESGMKWADNMSRPWPWTINSPSTGPMRFKTKEEAYRKIKSLIDQGQYNIDIGMMQVNLYWHWEKINNVDILEPSVNLLVAAEILKQAMHDAQGDVGKAIGIYHTGSAGPQDRRDNYRKRAEKFEFAMMRQYN